MPVLTGVITLLLSLVHPQAGPRTVTIGVDDTMKYSVTSITAAPGEKLRVVVKSTGKLAKAMMAHNFVLLKKDTDAAGFIKAGLADKATDFIAASEKDKVLAATPMAGAGETVEVTFTAPDAKGSYPYVCTFPGHFAMGMKGTLTVK
jgi:azurin